jgi:malate/lactate dehydrogenase
MMVMSRVETSADNELIVKADVSDVLPFPPPDGFTVTVGEPIDVYAVVLIQTVLFLLAPFVE